MKNHCVAALLFAALASCETTYPTGALPASEFATLSPVENWESFPVFNVEEVRGRLPYSIPVAAWVDLKSESAELRLTARKAAKRGSLLGADFAVLGEESDKLTTLSTFTVPFRVGGTWGAASVPVQQTFVAISGYSMVIADTALAFLTNDLRMVTFVAEHVQESGLLPGDTLISVNGADYEYAKDSDHWSVLVALQPGDAVELRWLRPGTGYMTGSFTCIENSGSLEGLPMISTKLADYEQPHRPY